MYLWSVSLHHIVDLFETDAQLRWCGVATRPLCLWLSFTIPVLLSLQFLRGVSWAVEVSFVSSYYEPHDCWLHPYLWLHEHEHWCPYTLQWWATGEISNGQPMASDNATHIPTSGSEKMVPYSTHVLCTFTSLVGKDADICTKTVYYSSVIVTCGIKLFSGYKVLT